MLGRGESLDCRPDAPPGFRGEHASSPTRARQPFSLGVLRKVLLFTTQRFQQFGAAGFGVEGRKAAGAARCWPPNAAAGCGTQRTGLTSMLRHGTFLEPFVFPEWALGLQQGARPGQNRGVMPPPPGKRLTRVLALARLDYGAKTHARGGHRKGSGDNARGGGPQAPAPPPMTGQYRARGRCGRRFPGGRHIHCMLDP